MNISNVPSLHLACLDGNTDSAKRARLSGPAVNRTVSYSPLLIAVVKGNYNLAKLILDSGPNVHLEAGLLVEAICNPADEVDTCELLELLLSKGADANSANRKGFTPLMAAMEMGSPQMVKILVQNGASVAQFASRKFHIEDLHMLEAFMDTGLKMTECRDWVNPTLLCAILGYLCDVDVKKRMLEHLVARGANINFKDDYDMTPLHVACGYIPDGENEAIYHYHGEIVGFLLANGANPNAELRDGRTALHILCDLDLNDGPGGTDEENLDLVLDCIKLLLDHGADSDLCDDDGRTPLEMAIVAEKDEIVDVLLAHKMAELPEFPEFYD
jgi:ankyrin repeat protein